MTTTLQELQQDLARTHPLKPITRRDFAKMLLGVIEVQTANDAKMSLVLQKLTQMQDEAKKPSRASKSEDKS